MEASQLLYQEKTTTGSSATACCSPQRQRQRERQCQRERPQGNDHHKQQQQLQQKNRMPFVFNTNKLSQPLSTTKASKQILLFSMSLVMTMITLSSFVIHIVDKFPTVTGTMTNTITPMITTTRTTKFTTTAFNCAFITSSRRRQHLEQQQQFHYDNCRRNAYKQIEMKKFSRDSELLFSLTRLPSLSSSSSSPSLSASVESELINNFTDQVPIHYNNNNKTISDFTDINSNGVHSQSFSTTPTKIATTSAAAMTTLSENVSNNNNHNLTNGSTDNDISQRPLQVILQNEEDQEEKTDDDDDLDIARPTENGGFTHTKTSKAKISAANKGKTPWNKGKARSEEVRARIAEGVRKKNRERFLEKLKAMNMTEAEYLEQKRVERNKKEAERRARRTEKGGYRPTEETKQKISKILKTKFANGEIKRGKVDPAKVRRGFTHTEETRKKISESLKKRWAEDPEYRENMLNKTIVASTDATIRQRISETLRNKWKDPEFREKMLNKISSRRKPRPGSRSQELMDEHRRKISEAMKLKWKDENYRKRATESMAKYQEKKALLSPPRPKKKKTTKPKPKPLTPVRPSLKQPKQQSNKKIMSNNSNHEDDDEEDAANNEVPSQRQLLPRRAIPLRKPNSKVKAKRPKTLKSPASRSPAATPKSSILQRQGGGARQDDATSSKSEAIHPGSSRRRTSTRELINIVHDDDGDFDGNDDDDALPSLKRSVKGSKNKTPKKKKDSGDVSQLREERRDLYDLLYGDEEKDKPSSSRSPSSSSTTEYNDDNDMGSSGLSSLFHDLGDENLDTFDPYGLEDF